MTPGSVIAVLCGDPGGASAVAPVIEQLQQDKRAVIHALAYLQAHEQWLHRSLPHQEIPLELPFDPAAWLKATSARLLVTGTSINAYEHEKQAIAAARAMGFPSLAVLDFWSNYRERFSDRNGDLIYLPDCIAVMDELARDEMCAVGIDRERIRITGHPALDSLEIYRSDFTSTDRKSIRDEHGAGDADWLILYASQPPDFSGQETDEQAKPWMNRLRAVRALIEALENLPARHGKTITLLIRPHPRESGDIYAAIQSARIAVKVWRDGDTRAMALAADLVVGMSTMFLVSSSYLGVPTLSLRLGCPLPDDFPPNRLGLTHPVYDEAELENRLQALLLTASRKRPPLPPEAGKASQNVAKLAYSMLGI